MVVGLLYFQKKALHNRKKGQILKWPKYFYQRWIPNARIVSKIGIGLGSKEDSISDDESGFGIKKVSSEFDESIIIGTGSRRRLGLTTGLRLGLVARVSLGLIQDLSLICLGWMSTGGVEDSPLLIFEDFVWVPSLEKSERNKIFFSIKHAPWISEDVG